MNNTTWRQKYNGDHMMIYLLEDERRMKKRLIVQADVHVCWQKRIQ